MNRDLPVAPKASKRGAPVSGAPMESEPDPATLEEIDALEARLAALKQKAKAAAGPPPSGK